MSQTKQTRNKALVLEAFDTLFKKRDHVADGRWQAFDFAHGLGERGTFCHKKAATEVRPASTVLIDETYSASPSLRDLVDLTVLVHVEAETRHFRRAMRESDHSEFLTKWHSVWDEVEQYYFAVVCPPESFDLVVENEGYSTWPDAARPN
jgi:uridine kinase